MRLSGFFLVIFLGMMGCGPGETSGSNGGTGGAGGTSASGGTGGGGGEAPSVARGEYMAEHVGPCGQCHTPKKANGMPDDALHFGGNDCFLDVLPADDQAGCIAAPNLTNDATGLKGYTDDEIREMITNGTRPDGSAMFPFMPYFLIHAYSNNDVDSILLYLRSLPPVNHPKPQNQPPFDQPPPQPAPPLADDEMPMPTTVDDATTRGRYLAAPACLLCHTPVTDPMDFRSLDKTKLFGGGSMFVSAVIGLPAPPLPDIIYSTNLTPDPSTGLTYTKQQLITLLKTGEDKDGMPLCPPMPVGDAYGGLTDADLSDIADYLLALPPIQNAVAGTCVGQ